MSAQCSLHFNTDDIYISDFVTCICLILWAIFKKIQTVFTVWPGIWTLAENPMHFNTDDMYFSDFVTCISLILWTIFLFKRLRQYWQYGWEAGALSNMQVGRTPNAFQYWCFHDGWDRPTNVPLLHTKSCFNVSPCTFPTSSWFVMQTVYKSLC